MVGYDVLRACITIGVYVKFVKDVRGTMVVLTVIVQQLYAFW